MPEIWGKWVNVDRNLGKMGKCGPKFGGKWAIWAEIG